ncbi:prepilin-type N-terminal cleavage/methylation domain-containing protein [Kribbella sancticallisti]|uniref:Prepilin-type N-terminal cleavage/methylation domain-containing protein n=1 Tax=Kribbella sancticallisti TaxID=460087 RepID=A0ABN2EB16_9ACTN
MLDRIREARKNQSGFTLIELLIVIVILGVLSGIVVFAVAGITDRGNAAACKADMSSVEVAVEAYRAKTGAYPDAGAAGYTQLTSGDDQFLRSVPTTANGYTITLGADGAVTAAPANCVFP